jgi:hypothetical protein
MRRRRSSQFLLAPALALVASTGALGPAGEPEPTSEAFRLTWCGCRRRFHLKTEQATTVLAKARGWCLTSGG